MKRICIALSVGLMAVCLTNLKAQEMNIRDKVSYLVGYSTGQQMSQIPYDFDLESLFDGITAGIRGEAGAIEAAEGQRILAEWQNEIQQKMQREATEKALENKVKGKQFMADNLKDPAVKQTASGLQYKVVTEGKGAKPKATDQVKVHYTGTLLDGTVFDSSVQRGEPITFPLNGVIRGWTEGLQLMSEGSKYILYIPSDLAYGDSGTGPIPAGATLIFEVELLEVVK